MTMKTDDLELAVGAVTIQASNWPDEARGALERANDFARAEKAPNTRRAYRSDFGAFRAWCAGRGVPSLPATAQTVAAYLAAEADRGIKASTIGRRAAAIKFAHKLVGVTAPTDVEAVRAVIRGIRRTIGTAKTPKAPATNERLLAMVVCQNRESQKTKWVVESQDRDGGCPASGRRSARLHE
jgi:hypothetical protein